MSFFQRLGRAATATVEAHNEAEYLAKGEPITCPVCQGRKFVRTSERTTVKPLFLRRNLPWLRLDNRTTTLICTHCTHLMFFARRPEEQPQNLEA